MDKRILTSLSLNEVTAFYVLNLLLSNNLVDYACKVLEEGLQSDALNRLAGELNPEMTIAAPLFEQALRELSVPKPTKLDAQLTVAHSYARAIVDGRLMPYEGARNIWMQISNEIDNPSSLLTTFVGAASEIEDLPDRYAGDTYDPTPLIEEYKKDIIEAAKKLLTINDPSQLLSTNSAG